MSDEETAWDTKSPAFLVKMRGALDAAGNLVALRLQRAIAATTIISATTSRHRLIAQLMGTRRPGRPAGSASIPSDSYAIPNRRTTADVVSLPEFWETPLRTGNLRDPNGPQSTFASESFIDEPAAAAKADPLEFRLKLLATGHRRRHRFHVVPDRLLFSRPQPRLTAGTARPSPKPLDKGNILTGRGIAYTFRGNSMVAQIAEVEVNRQTGHVFAKRLVCAYDCRLRGQPGSFAPYRRMRNAARFEPRAPRGSSLRYGKGHQPRLVLSPHASPRRYPRRLESSS